MSEPTAEETIIHLMARGVHQRTARQLVQRYGPAYVCRYIRHFDALRRSGQGPRRAGWLVAAIKQGYTIEEAPAAPSLYTHAEALDWLAARRIELSSSNPFTRYFTPVRQADGTTLFRRTEPST